MTTLPNEEARPEMDDLLHDYFQTEMPKPWPAFKAPMSVRTKSSMSLWSRTVGRLALAGTIALLVIGYLTVGTFFPRSQIRLEKAAEDISQREKKSKSNTPAPNANQAEDPKPTPMPMP
jgi:hypothetical protein